MNRTTIAAIFADQDKLGGKTVTVCGWARTIRDMKRPFVYFVRQAQASPSSMPRTTAISCAAAPACSRYDSAVP